MPMRHTPYTTCILHILKLSTEPLSRANVIGKVKMMRLAQFSDRLFQSAVDKLLREHKIELENGMFRPNQPDNERQKVNKRKRKLLDVPPTFEEKIEMLEYFNARAEFKKVKLVDRLQQFTKTSVTGKWLVNRIKFYERIQRSNAKELDMWASLHATASDASNVDGGSSSSGDGLTDDDIEPEPVQYTAM